MNSDLLQDRVATFFFKKEEGRSLSNFWPCLVIMGEEERMYESGEHAFHGEKYVRLSQTCRDVEKKQKMEAYGARFLKPSIYTTAAEAKRAGGKKGFLLNKEELELWGKESNEVQDEICRYKSYHYEEVKQDLLQTGDKILVHPALRCSDEKVQYKFWEGRAKVVDHEIVILGENRLGNMWMKWRNMVF
jgi:predicted NAD-dependent protein-ADP-ribosyltransferase YbiA (DUF1768 family)